MFINGNRRVHIPHILWINNTFHRTLTSLLHFLLRSVTPLILCIIFILHGDSSTMTYKQYEREFLIHRIDHTPAHVSLSLWFKLQIVLGMKLFFKLSASELRTFLKKMSVSSYEMFRSELSNITKRTIVKSLSSLFHSLYHL